MTKHASPTEQIHSFLKALHPGNDWFELRGLQSGPTWAAYHCDAAKATEDAIFFDEQEFGAYVTINPVNEEASSIAPERASEVKATTRDQQVQKRNWLPIDVDPIRAAGQAATDAEKQGALLLADEIRQYLANLNWSEPIRCASPNGAHLLYQIDLPNDNEAKQLLKRTLEALSDRFSTDAAKVDKTLFNAARILRIPGTTGRKGEPTTERPHRRGELLSVPNSLDPVTQAQLEALATQPVLQKDRKAIHSPSEQGSAPAGTSTQFPTPEALHAFLMSHGVTAIRRQDKEDGSYFHLAECPIAGSRGGTSVSVVWRGGQVTYHNLHNSGSGISWRDVLVELLSREQWPELMPLERESDEGLPFPLEVLPPIMRAAIEEVTGYVKAPVPLAYASAMGALSLAGQALADQARDSEQKGPISLYLLTIGSSGERKSSCDKMFRSGIDEFTRKKQDESKQQLAAHKARRFLFEEERKAAEKRVRDALGTDESEEAAKALAQIHNGEPPEPKTPRLLYTDTTAEALALNLKSTWPSGGILTAEAGQMFGGYSMTRDNVVSSLSQFNVFWDGTSFQVDRKTSESFQVEGVRLTLGLQAQPGILSDFVTRTPAARASGWLSRFLIANPKSTRGTRFYSSPPDSMPKLTAFNARLRLLLEEALPIDESGRLTPPRIGMNEEAKRFWIGFHDRIESELGPAGNLCDVSDVASKTADNAMRIATLFYLLETADQARGSQLALEFIKAGCALAEWHLSEAKRLFMEIRQSEDMRSEFQLDEWLTNRCTRQLVGRLPVAEVLQKGPNLLRNAAALNRAMEGLEHTGRARWLCDGRRKFIQVNPTLLKAANANAANEANTKRHAA